MSCLCYTESCRNLSHLRKATLSFNVFQTTIIHKIFETNSSFPMKQRSTEKIQSPHFRRFLQVLGKRSYREEDWTLGNNSMKF